MARYQIGRRPCGRRRREGVDEAPTGPSSGYRCGGARTQRTINRRRHALRGKAARARSSRAGASAVTSSARPSFRRLFPLRGTGGGGRPAKSVIACRGITCFGACGARRDERDRRRSENSSVSAFLASVSRRRSPAPVPRASRRRTGLSELREVQSGPREIRRRTPRASRSVAVFTSCSDPCGGRGPAALHAGRALPHELRRSGASPAFLDQPLPRRSSSWRSLTNLAFRRSPPYRSTPRESELDGAAGGAPRDAIDLIARCARSHASCLQEGRRAWLQGGPGCGARGRARRRWSIGENLRRSRVGDDARQVSSSPAGRHAEEARARGARRPRSAGAWPRRVGTAPERRSLAAVRIRRPARGPRRQRSLPIARCADLLRAAATGASAPAPALDPGRPAADPEAGCRRLRCCYRHRASSARFGRLTPALFHGPMVATPTWRAA